MGNQVYQEGDFKVYKVGHNFIVHNANYEFSDKHSHISNFNAAKSVAHMACQKILPKNFSSYLLTSLIRISDDDSYVGKIRCLMDTREQKGNKLRYCNTA